MEKHILKLKLDTINITTQSFLDTIQYNQFGLSNNDFLNDIKITKKFKTYGNVHFLYFFSDDIANHVYVALVDTPFKFWSKISTLDDLVYLLELYNLNNDVNKYMFKYRIERGYITANIPNMHVFEKYVYLNQMIIALPWGKDFKPDIFILDEKDPFEIAIYNSVILEENSNEINFMTKYSRSIISVTCVDEKYFVQLKYKCTSENKTLPQDLIAVLESFPKFIQYRELLKLNPPMIQEALISSSGIPMFLDNIYDDLIILHKNNIDYNDELKTEINDTLAKMTANKEIFNYVNKENDINEKQLLKQIIKTCNNINVKISNINIKDHVKMVLQSI